MTGEAFLLLATGAAIAAIAFGILGLFLWANRRGH